MARWLPLLLTIGSLGFASASCGMDHPASAAATTPAVGEAAPAAAPPAAAQPASGAPGKPIPGPAVTMMPDGSAVLGPRVGDVAMLRRMPDGTFKQVCGAAEPDMRDMIQAKMRARRGAK
jgi:hypothetical protein